MKLYLFRHGATRGNREHRYVGRTDEGILASEKERLRQKGRLFPAPDGLFASPSCRCLETAQALYPSLFPPKGNIILEPDLREMDFGEFEYKNYQELDGNPAYQKYLDSGGTTGFPGGEEPEEFRRRCREGFCRCVCTAQEHQWETVAFAVHGGTIMSIMEGFAEPPGGYFEYQVQNGCGYLTELTEYGREAPEPEAAGVLFSPEEMISIKLTIEEEIR